MRELFIQYISQIHEEHPVNKIIIDVNNIYALKNLGTHVKNRTLE